MGRFPAHGRDHDTLPRALLDGAYRFGEPCVLDLKGKGPTRAWYLLGRDGA